MYLHTINSLYIFKQNNSFVFDRVHHYWYMFIIHSVSRSQWVIVINVHLHTLLSSYLQSAWNVLRVTRKRENLKAYHCSRGGTHWTCGTTEYQTENIRWNIHIERNWRDELLSTGHVAFSIIRFSRAYFLTHSTRRTKTMHYNVAMMM